MIIAQGDPEVSVLCADCANPARPKWAEHAVSFVSTAIFEQTVQVRDRMLAVARGIS